MNAGQVDKTFAELREILDDRITTSSAHRMAYTRDWSPHYREMDDLPDIIVIPHDTQEMVRITRVAYLYEIPLVPFAEVTGRAEGRLPGKAGFWWKPKG